jgi:vacuolar-type H+-ATPase subunit F/Vma7
VKGSVHLVATPEVGLGFHLAGLKPVEAATPAECAHRLVELASQPDCGIVLVEDRLYDGVAPETRRLLGDRQFPLIVTFPGPVMVPGEAAFEERIAELLRQAIGYRVRLR